jgi:hypothetical protein
LGSSALFILASILNMAVLYLCNPKYKKRQLD